MNLEKKQKKFSVVVASPVRQKPAILREFLESLEILQQNSYKLSYFFIDDNTNQESKEILEQFAKKHKKRCFLQKTAVDNQTYECNESTHLWNDALIWKVASFKDKMIEYAKNNAYDYLFLIDSDIVLHPKTVDQLILANKEIVSNIFWTWTDNSIARPQIWMMDQWVQFELASGEQISEKEKAKRFAEFLTKMRVPGTYEVGGLGACTLISKKALSKEISFQKVNNIAFWGEDRHFCIRAVVLGLGLYVDTHYPAYHIYRETDLPDVENFKRSFSKSLDFSGKTKPRITLSMVMRNEASRYLRLVLEAAREYISDAVIIDDASTDNSVTVCEEVLQGIPLILVRNKEPLFSNEIELRKKQWDETIKTNPDWMLFLDADEIFEVKFGRHIQKYILDPRHGDVFYFRLFDFWNENHYRDDEHWRAHMTFSPFLIRYRPDISYCWERETPQHCGRVPSTVRKLLGNLNPLRLKHYGWAKEKDRKAKFERYKLLDPEAKYGVKEQYESILDPNPNLVRWVEDSWRESQL